MCSLPFIKSLSPPAGNTSPFPAAVTVNEQNCFWRLVSKVDAQRHSQNKPRQLRGAVGPAKGSGSMNQCRTTAPWLWGGKPVDSVSWGSLCSSVSGQCGPHIRGASGNWERAGGGERRPRFAYLTQLHPLPWPCDTGQVTLLMFKTTGNKPSLLSHPCLCLPTKVLERSPQGEDSSPHPRFHRSRA